MGTLVLAGATSGSTTLTPVDAVTTVLTLPSATATLATLGANTFTGNQSITGTLGVTGTSTLAAVNTSGSILAASGANYLTTGAAPVYIGGRSTTGDGYIGVNVKVGVGNYVVNGFAGQIYYDAAGAWNFSTAASGTAGNAVSDTSKMTISNAGAVTMPAQPAFLAFAADQANVTGDGTYYTVLFATEIFDQGSNFASPTFTAPVTGRYRFSVTVRLEGVLVGHTSSILQFVTSNRNYAISIINPFVIFDATNGLVTLSGTTLADMDAADTCTVTIVVSNSTKTVDIGSSCFFSGELVC